MLSTFTYSQFGVGNSNNTYDVYIIEKPKQNPYGNSVDYTRDAYESGRTQAALQKRYDYNYERLSNAINDIGSKLYALNINRDAKNRLINRWNVYINKMRTWKINYTSTSEVTNIINSTYDQVNKAIYEETN